MIFINQNKNGNVIAILLKASMAISMCVFFAACGEDSSNNSNTSEQAACSVSKNDDGESYTLKCLDGTEVVIHDGKDGEKGADGSDGKDGEKGSDGKNGQNGSDGKNGTDGKNGEDGNDGLSGISGEGCSVKANDDGSFALSCPDGTSIVFNADGKVSQITKDSTDITPKISSSSTGKTNDGSSSSTKADGKSSSSKKTGVQPQGFVQFNADIFTSTAGNAIYLYDEDNPSQTATVTVRSVTAADTITLTLDRHEQYFYAPFQMSVYGGNGNVLKVMLNDFVVVEYEDASTGVTEIDAASVALRGSDEISLSFGRKLYSDTLDKAVITLVDSSLTADVDVFVKVTTSVGSADIALYPVEGGNGTERIGFVGFTFREPLEGEVEIANGSVTATYIGKTASTEWVADKYYGLVCSMDGEIQRGAGGLFVCDLNEFRILNERESVVGKACTSYNEMDSVKVDGVDWLCSSGKWKVTVKHVMGTMKDSRDGKTYKTVTIGSQTWMAENLNYEYKVEGESYGNYCNTDDCKIYGRFYTWAAAMDSAGVYSLNGKECGKGKTCSPNYPVQGICPKGWHLPDTTEWKTLYKAIFVGSTAVFWSASEYNGTNATNGYLSAGSVRLNVLTYKYIGFSVRCLKDSE